MTAPVSVIIPFYDGHDLVARAVTSIARQTLRPAEIVIVDDGSAVPLDPQRFDGRIPVRVVHHATNRGIPAARNTGVSKASERWLAFLDQDDEWLPGRLESQWALAKARRAPSVLFGRACTLAGGRAITWPSRGSLRLLTRSQEDALKVLLGRGNLVPHITLLLDRDTLDLAGGFDEGLTGGSDDYGLMLNLATTGVPFVAVRRVLAVRHATGLNFSDPERFLADDVRLLRDLASRNEMVRRRLAAGLAAAHYRCARALASRSPERARELYNEALRLQPGVRSMAGRVLLSIAPCAADRVAGIHRRLMRFTASVL